MLKHSDPHFVAMESGKRTGLPAEAPVAARVIALLINIFTIMILTYYLCKGDYNEELTDMLTSKKRNDCLF